MSDTDDTDVLLLIPPNFFLVQSSGSDESLLESSRTVVHKPLSCTAQVIGKLVNQVQTLESRLESLEISSDLSSLGVKSRHKTLDSTDSFDNQSDRKCFTFPRRRRRKTNRAEVRRDLSLTSLDSLSTDRKSIPPLKLKEYYHKELESINDTRSMDGDISSIVSTPSKKNDKLLLNEIDEFLTKVETYESPESKYKDKDISLSPENIIKATSNYISRKLDSKHDDSEQIQLPSGRIVTSNVLDKYIYLVKSNPSSAQGDKPQTSTSSFKSESNLTRLNDTTKNDTQIPLETKSPTIRRLNFTEKDVQPTSTPKRPTHTYADTFRPTTNKIYDRATKVLEQYKAQSSRNTQSSTDSYLSSLQKEEFKFPQMRPYGLENKDKLQNKMLETIDTDLLSLSELWGERGERERADRVESVKLEEEKLKREHCEAIIQQLQRKVLEQQEKLAVAIKVDKAKDLAIAKLKDAWLRITGSLDKAEERHRAALDKMVREVENFKSCADDAQKKTSHFEAELYKALDLAHDYQEKCKQLVTEKKELQEQHDKILLSKQEIIENRDKEIEVLKENYETVMRLNKQSTDCVKSLEEAFEKEKSEHEQTKQKLIDLTNKIESLSDETTLLSQERDLLKGKVNEERARCNILESQLCEKQNQTSELLRKCDTLDCETKSLRKAIEVQKVELKSHYQKQLEDAVLGKLAEFQLQLDRATAELTREARQREEQLQQAFGGQLTNIQQQHKLEVSVLEEKQREEIKLYRLQLAQASEKIGLLESKLESFRRRRGELASQLHDVMEAQWAQALRILTHHEHRQHGHASPAVLPELPRVPPSPSPARPLTALADKNFNFEQLSDHELQQYVKLLLTKPVSAEAPPSPPPRDDPTPDRERTKGKRNINFGKPPWKA